MPDPLGLSFMPDAQGNGSQDQNGPRPTPVQQAIQTLSLRIPRTVGASGGAPQQLLQGAGGAGLGGNPNAAAMLEQIRRMLFGGGGGHFGLPNLPRAGDPGMGGAPFGGGMPMPRDPGPSADAGGRGTLPMPNVGFPVPGVKDPNDNNGPAAAPAPSPLGGSAMPTPVGQRDRRI